MPSFTNQATLSYRGNVTISNIVTGELVAVLSATKTALSERYGADDILTYVISIVNSGPAPYTGLTMTDDLGAYTYGTGTLTPLTYVDGSLRYFVNGVLQATPTPTADAPLTVPGIAVPAGGNALLIYETRVNSFAPLDTESTVTNTATLSGAGSGSQHSQRPRRRLPDHRQGSQPCHGSGERHADLYLHHPELRQHCGGGNGQCHGFGHLLAHPESHIRHLQRRGVDRRNAVHLQRRDRRVRYDCRTDHGTRRFADARCRHRRRRCHPRHQYTDRDRNSLSTSPIPNERCCQKAQCFLTAPPNAGRFCP